MQDVCVTKAAVEAGEELDASMLKTVSVPRNAIVAGALLPSEADKVNGRVSAGYIPSGAQMSKSLAVAKEQAPAKTTSYFVRNKDWIYMRSSSLRAGDTVEIRSADGMTNFGTFSAAFIKDAEESEVSDIEDSGISFTEKDKDDRSRSTAAVDHIEIETELDTYLAISSHSPLAKSRDIPVEELNDETLYLLSVAEMKAPEQRALKTCKKIGFTPKEIKYMPSYFSLEMAVKNNRGFAICGSNIIDRFGSDIKVFPIPSPDKDQYVILAVRQSGGSTLAEQFVKAIPEYSDR
jgi:hypothetical protein